MKRAARSELAPPADPDIRAAERLTADEAGSIGLASVPTFAILCETADGQKVTMYGTDMEYFALFEAAVESHRRGDAAPQLITLRTDRLALHGYGWPSIIKLEDAR
ncbi:hypothetical protein [Lacisediminihabitans changchengi]|uniref:Uncharacterized protein n=1 Tax=Lacisediminihabitans changchengi TaxID=2787634 RepID=A0A934SIF3_9MICO|nr:hypothetical protein [Lacisediminihabitans changchengi]MBK4347241.1 hypothetical protein [Lacisediminihabitans changchengi]